MNGKTKSEKHQEHKAKKRKEAKRKAKIHKNQVLGYRHLLRPKSCRPKQITYQVSSKVIGIIFTWRHQLGWGGHRIAAELKRREMATISGRTVSNILDRLGLPVKPYALKGKSDGIAYRRYEKARPNIQWHMDLKQSKLGDGTTVYICIVIDDYSRYVLWASVELEKTAAFTAQAVKDAMGKAGKPDEIVTDNGREFVSPWEDSLTQFGHQLEQGNIDHLTTPPYYPQANGKAEAFIKTLNRELLSRHSFASVEQLQTAVNEFLSYYNNYRGHSSLGWQAPVTRFAGLSPTRGAEFRKVLVVQTRTRNHTRTR